LHKRKTLPLAVNAEALVNQLARPAAPLVTNLVKSRAEKTRLKKLANSLIFQ